MTVRVSAAAIRARLRGLANLTIAAHSARFFKSGPGEYGAGDRFLGVRVPDLRRVAREFRAAPLGVALALLRSPLHEERLLALVLLVEHFERGDESERARIYAQFRKHTPRYVNNWDLVDSAAYQIVGAISSRATVARSTSSRARRAYGSGASRSSQRSVTSKRARSTTRSRSRESCWETARI